MSRDFYKYIATRIVEFFRQESENMHNGDRFCLKLDNYEMVAKVNNALIEETASHSIQGTFVLSDTYETYTIKLSEREIVVAAQIGNMTDDFFATLRNLTLDINPNPILMISCSPIDTITSATRDMSAKGMPFHADALIETIDRDIKASSSLASDDAYLLSHELNRVKRDRFADKKSLFEYKSFLSSLRRGTVEQDDWIDFRLLPDNFSTVPESKRGERINSNHDDFETIDRAFRYGNIRDALGGDYDNALISELETKKRNGRPWHETLDYAKLLLSKAKKERKQNNPLNIEDEDISAYYDMPMLYSFDVDEKMFIRNAGESKAKQRDKNILIYNPDKKDHVDLRITTNVALKKDGVIRKDTDNTNVDINHKEYIFHITTSGCTFSQVELYDGENSIRYRFRICILDIAPAFLKNIQTCYRIDGSGKKRRIVIEGVKGQLIINPGQNDGITHDLKEQGVYACNYDQTLRLDIDEESISPDSGKLNFIISLSTLDIPFTLSDDIVKPTELTGIKAFKLKNAQKRGLEYRGENRVDLGTVRYYVRGAFEEDLLKEAFIIENSAAYVEIDDEGIHKKDIEISENVRFAYDNMVSLIKSRNQLPSLSFYDEKMIEVATCYVNAVKAFFSSIEQGKILTGIHNNTLLLGLVYDRTTNTIALSPLHPLNVIYQLELVKQNNVDKVRDDIVERLTSANLLPYIKHFDSRELYEVVEQRNSPEWHYYAPMDNKRFKGARDFVPKLVKEKIEEYHAHFKFLFGDIGSNRMKISLHNLGDCKEILHGIILYYRKQLKDNMLPEELLGFDIDIYGKNDAVSSTDFSILSSLKRVKAYLDNIDAKSELNSDLAAILVSKIQTFIHKPNETSYKYSHIAFYEMISSEDSGDSLISGLTTGASLDGLVSGIPSVYSEGWYKTGFGTNYATDSELIMFASLLNALYRVAFSSSTYTEDHCITTEISKGSSDQLEKVYSSANWIVFVDPKVDLSFFYQDDSSKNLLIIHYGDQNSSASGYNAITVTRKSEQYENIIAQELNKNGIAATSESAKKIIDFFNAINGRWLLRLISSKKALESNFSREKMSIISAIKFAMAYYSHKDIVWIPLSLEEILRVSGNTGLSQDGLLSAKNLGFEQGATCDDLLLIGVEHGTGKLKVHIHPIEVKIGNNSNAILDKAQKQLSNTYRGFMDALWPEGEERYSIERKVVRNFVMQLAILSCEKMKLYGIYPEEEWNIILDKYRCDLLNENYTISDDLNKYIGIGTVVSFKQDEVLISGSRNDDNDIVLTHLPEKEGYDYLVKSIAEIEEQVNEAKYLPPKLPVLLNDATSETVFEQQVIAHRDALKDIIPSNDDEESTEVVSDVETVEETEEATAEIDIDSSTTEEVSVEASTEISASNEMCVLFGHDQSNGQPLYWHPGNTDEVFHTNTGIIGTMGTGKTQFTQSLVTQLYRERVNNVGEPNIGILIFDYKGDYNESKENFVKATNATVLKPYHLPYNPLALTMPRVFKPLLPIHVANAFNDTLSRVYHLGPKQSSSLLNCIKDAYAQKGISPADSSTWSLTAPTFHDVFRIYMDNENIKKNDSLEAALSKLNDFEVFESDPSKTKSLFDLLNGVVVVDISGYDSDIQNLIIAITLDLFYAQMQAMGSSKLSGKHRQLTKMILVDEADNFLHEGFPSLKKILKEGREFGIGTILSTQFLKHFGSGEDDFSKYILTWVVHNVADLKNTDIRFVFNTEANSTLENKLFNDVKKLQKHHSIVKIGNKQTPIYIKDKAFWQLYNEIKD